MYRALAFLLLMTASVAQAQSVNLPASNLDELRCSKLFPQQIIEKAFELIVLQPMSTANSCEWLLGDPNAPAGTPTMNLRYSFYTMKSSEEARASFEAEAKQAPSRQPFPEVSGAFYFVFGAVDGPNTSLLVQALDGSRINKIQVDARPVTNRQLRQGLDFARLAFAKIQ